MITEEQTTKIRGDILLILASESPAEKKIEEIMQAVLDAMTS